MLRNKTDKGRVSAQERMLAFPCKSRGLSHKENKRKRFGKLSSYDYSVIIHANKLPTEAVENQAASWADARMRRCLLNK